MSCEEAPLHRVKSDEAPGPAGGSDQWHKMSGQTEGQGQYLCIWTGAPTPLSGCCTLWISNRTRCTSGTSVRKRIMAFCLKWSKARSRWNVIRGKTSRFTTRHLLMTTLRVWRLRHIRPKAAISTFDMVTSYCPKVVLKGLLEKNDRTKKTRKLGGKSLEKQQFS